MRKSIFAFALASTLAAPFTASAQTAPAADAKPASPHTFTGNMTIASDYRFRGIDQTFGKPAIQGGIDYSHSSGIYLGNWNSNVSSGAGYPAGNIEMDLYGGWKNTWGDWGLDVGTIYYYYPGTSISATNGSAASFVNPRTGASKTGSVHNQEIYIGGSWKWISLKVYDAISDYFSLPGTKNTYYWDLSANYDLGDGWGIVGHLGQLKVKGWSNGTPATNLNYTDYKLGVSKDVSGWVLGAAFVGTSAKGNCANGDFYCFGNNASLATSTSTTNAGRSTIVLSVTKTF
ncbi:MAG: hypothetical protein JO035_05960 [Betaproteobacteria bacterium]|nr:hypothetical protein [Betaproteobacteria bacterium]